MRTSITVRSWGLLAIGLICAAVTARTLFDDVISSGALVTVNHLQSAVALLAALVSGHVLIPTLKRGAIASTLGLVLIFVSATGYCVVAAGARNAEVAAAKSSKIEATNEQREAAERKAAEARDAEAQAKDEARAAAEAAGRECATGEGKRCRGKRDTRDFANDQAEKATAYRILAEAQLTVLTPKQEAHAGYAHTARIIEALPYVTTPASDIEPRLTLLMPFAVVLISEVGTLVFLGMALGHKVPVPANVPGNCIPEIPEKRIPGNRKPPSGPKGGRRGRRADPKVLDFSERFSRNNGRPPSGSEIKAAFPELPTSTAYDYAARAKRPALKVVA